MTKPPRIDVFISSTSIDLPEHRAAVRDAILNLGMFPSGMEHWPVSGENPVYLCRRMVNDAEIYLGIYAHRYGWMPKGYDGKGITEMEYDWAGEVKHAGKPIPRLCFVMSDKHPWPKDRMEVGAEAELSRFKARVKENQVGFFTTPDDLKAQVIAALAPFVPHGQPIPAAYLRWLHEQSKKSGLLHVLTPRDASSDAQPITVDQVYTLLDTRRQVKRQEDGKIIWKEWRSDEEFQFRSGAKDESQYSPLTAMEASNFHSRFVLLGDPGSGKSTFVSFLALCLTGHMLDPDKGWLKKLEDQGWEQGEKLPIFITLRDFAQDTLKDAARGTAELIFRHVESNLRQWKLEEAFPALKNALEQGRALVLLDGLDEVPPEKRDLVRDAVSDFMARCHPDNCTIVTCRILSYTNPAWHIPELNVETIAPFDEEKIDHFIKAWYTALQALHDLDAATAERRLTELTGMLRAYRLLDLAANPMLLTVMVVVHNHLGTLPRENARLYDECVKLLMLRWRPHDAQALIAELDVREDDLYRLLWEIAYDAHDRQAEREGAADISEAAILGIARRRLGENTAKAAAFCEYIEKRTGLLIGRGQDSYGMRVFTFPHRTFQEYLAGCYIASERFTRRLPELARRGAGWRDSLLLAAGNLVFNKGDIATPLDAINALCSERMKPQSDEDWRVIWLAGDMLLLVGVTNAENDDVGRDVLPRVCQLLVDLVSGGHLPPVERAAAGRVLSILGDPRPGIGVVVGAHSRAPLPDIAWCPVSAGEFLYGEDKETIDIPYDFDISKYPVTNAQFAAFIADGGYQTRDYWTEAGWEVKEEENWRQPRYWDDLDWNLANHPVVGVSWYEAVAFCNWLTARLYPNVWAAFMDANLLPSPLVAPADGLGVRGQIIRLPTEQEWEKAARGSDGRVYPWEGDEFDPARCNSSVGDQSIDRTSAVGVFPKGASPCGALDMSGNVWEWCLTTYKEGHNGINGTDAQVLRGGSWRSFDNDNFRADFHLRLNPGLRVNLRGFRPARS